MRTDFAAACATFIVVALVYLVTSAPGLGLVDSGELTVAAWSLGIAHPTGYPLYTLLGRVWLLLMPLDPARGMVLFSVFLGAAACALLAFTAERLLRPLQAVAAPARTGAAIFLTLALAFSPSAWQSVSFAEVYPLTAAIASALLLLALPREGQGVVTTALLACYLWGVGFGNHLTILWYLPLLVYLVVRGVRASLRPARTLGLAAALFALGASVNLYLPIRSSVQPLLDWSDPQRLDGLLRHITAWQYRVWMFKGDLGRFLIKFGDYLGNVHQDLGWGLLLAAALGGIALLFVRSWLLRTAFLVWLIGVGYNLNYEIPDISTYFFAFNCALFVAAVTGVSSLISRLSSGGSIPSLRATAVLLAVATGLPVLSVIAAAPHADQSDNRFAPSLSREVLRTLPDSALVFHGNWDIQSPSLYLQHVERYRPDVVLLDVALMQRPWYLRQEMRNHPHIFAGSERAVERFITAVQPFEAGQPYDGRSVETAFVAMHHAIIMQQLPLRPVYLRDAAQAGHPGIGRGFPVHPGAYFVRLTDQPTPEPAIAADSIHVDPRDPDPTRIRYLLDELTLAAAAQGHDALQRGDTTTLRRTLATVRAFAGPDPLLQDFVVRASAALDPVGVQP